MSNVIDPPSNNSANAQVQPAMQILVSLQAGNYFYHETIELKTFDTTLDCMRVPSCTVYYFPPLIYLKYAWYNYAGFFLREHPYL